MIGLALDHAVKDRRLRSESWPALGLPLNMARKQNPPIVFTENQLQIWMAAQKGLEAKLSFKDQNPIKFACLLKSGT